MECEDKLKEELKEDQSMLFLDGVYPTHNIKSGFASIVKGEEKIIENYSDTEENH